MGNSNSKIQRKRNLVKDSLYDMQVKRVHMREWHQEVKNLIEELKELEEEEEVEDPKWKELKKRFQKIVKKEKKRAKKKKQMQKNNS